MMQPKVSAAVGRFASVGACAAACLLLAHCSDSSRIDPRYGVAPSPRVIGFGEPVPKGGGVYRVGAPYVVAGRVYLPKADRHYRAEGLASWYGQDFRGRYTANGEIFDENAISAASPTLPLPCYARVTDLSNGRSLIVRVNDRGPYSGNRVIDVSRRAAELLGFHRRGTAWVHVEYVGRAPLEGSDDRMLAATLREDEPAPAPSRVRVAAAHVGPRSLALPPGHDTVVASAAATGAVPDPAGAAAMSFAAPSATMNGTAQFLNGRGLY
jgi:peptidoglycan lytic transglycosylase